MSHSFSDVANCDIYHRIMGFAYADARNLFLSHRRCFYVIWGVDLACNKLVSTDEEGRTLFVSARGS
ncbi:hypothetical protein L596_028159 [Steinernema carpocapsae]|uniref:Uncharacterized protein n=1 Tax=Steinernema carpocapsae TaxID=34508 RepID=A0A4U5LXL0_STECR|nr:hypothetical protein L596_028159 [Steinernema carpocapsae]